MSRFVSESLAKHDRSAFTSGNETIDGYFRKAVSQDIKRNYAGCYVLVEKATGTLAGFYTLSSNGIALTDLPNDVTRKLPRYPTVPAVLIGWLGRDRQFEGQGIGSMLLLNAMRRVLSSPVGTSALLADPIDEVAAAFYRRHLFAPLKGNAGRLFLPLSTVRTLVDGDGSSVAAGNS